MKVLIVAPHFQPAWDWGGMVGAIWNLAKGLASIGVEVIVITTNAKQEGIVCVPEERTERGVHIVTSPVLGQGRNKNVNRQGLSPALWMKLSKYVKYADIVHVNGVFGAIQPLASIISWSLRTPFVVTPHGSLDIWPLAQKRMKKSVYLHTLGRIIRSRASAFHFTVDEERRQAPSWLTKDNDFIIPVSLEPTISGNGERYRSRLGVGSDKLLVGLFGRLHKKKGFDVIIPALARSKRNDITLLVAGPDEAYYQSTIESMIRNTGLNNRIIFSGMLKGADLSDAYASIDVLLVPSYHENFGMVVVEASLQGKPCLVSNHVGLKDWVSSNDVGQVLPLEVDSWAQTFTELQKNVIKTRWKPERLTHLAKASFSIESVAAKMKEEYEAILNNYSK